MRIPAGSESFFQITALSATSATNAWALARTADALGRGIVLFQRAVQNNAPVWVERPLGSARFRNADTPALSITGVQALGGAADPLTATSAGVWIDLAMKVGGTPTDATIYFDPGAGPGDVTGSWCDAPSVCSQPLNARISGRRGYRSFAWAGPGFGTRVITNPLLPGGDDETNRGTYLSLEGSRFVRRPGGGGNFRRSGAFASATDGWLEGPVRIGTEDRPSKLESWPLVVAGVERTVPMAHLARLWRGDLATFWQAPPGYRDIESGLGTPARWLSERLEMVDRQGPVAPGSEAMRSRIYDFQLSHGLAPDGVPGPLTLMQLNRASGLPEPRLKGLTSGSRPS